MIVNLALLNKKQLSIVYGIAKRVLNTSAKNVTLGNLKGHSLSGKAEVNMRRHVGYSPFARVTGDKPGSVLIVALRGGVDAGGVGGLIAEHLLSSLEHERVASFNIDALLDYRTRRPWLTSSNGGLTGYEEPVLEVVRMRDDEGIPFFLLHGFEPDLYWDTCVQDMLTMIEEWQVELTVTTAGISWTIPHTRPTRLFTRASRSDLLVTPLLTPDLSGLRFSSSFGSLLEYRLTQMGADAVAYSAQVPNYVAQAEFPAAASALISAISQQTGLALPVGDLEAAAMVIRGEIDAQVNQAKEAQAIVQVFENQYDRAMELGDEEGLNSVGLQLKPDVIPTAEEIGAVVESFLARQTHDKKTDRQQPNKPFESTPDNINSPGNDDFGSD